MATKPAGNPNIFSQTANFPAGADPWSGMATKVVAPTAAGVGFTPETGIVSEYANFEFNITTTWSRWASFGSFLPGLDAHIIETDSAGATSIASMQVGGTAAGAIAFRAAENSGAAGTVILAINSTGGDSIVCQSSGGAGTAMDATNTGTGPAVDATNTGGGDAIIATGSGVGAGVRATTTGLGVGIVGTSNTGGTGISAVGNSTGIALAVSGLAGGDSLVTSAFGTGYAARIIGDATSPNRASLHIGPQNVDPSLSQVGDVYINDTEDSMKVRVSTAFQRVHLSDKGWVHGGSNNLSGARNGGAPVTMATVAMVGDDAPKVLGNVLLKVTLSVRNAAAALNHIVVDFFDLTAATLLDSTEIYLSQTNSTTTNAGARPNAFETTISLTAIETVAAGDRTFECRISTFTGGGTGIDFANLNFTVDGVF